MLGIFFSSYFFMFKTCIHLHLVIYSLHILCLYCRHQQTRGYTLNISGHSVLLLFVTYLTPEKLYHFSLSKLSLYCQSFLQYPEVDLPVNHTCSQVTFTDVCHKVTAWAVLWPFISAFSCIHLIFGILRIVSDPKFQAVSIMHLRTVTF